MLRYRFSSLGYIMEAKAVFAQLLAMAFLAQQSHGFSFTLKPVGTTKVTATPGDLIIYNAHLSISADTPLSFYVSLPYFQTPIINVEQIEVIGIGNNLQIWNEAVISYSQEDANSFQSRSQSSVDFGIVNRTAYSLKPGDDVVVQVQSRLLKHTNVTAGAVFWLYFGMEYKGDSVWVIGKSVKAEMKPGPANIAVTLKIPTGHSQLISEFEFEIDIYHLPDSKTSASDLSITLSIPSYLTTPVATANGASPAFTLSSSEFKIDFSEEFKVGQRAQISVTMTYGGSDKGKFVNGNIYGSFQYKTAINETSENCLKTVEKNVQMAFKLYAAADCDGEFSFASSTVMKASSAMLPCCPPEKATILPNQADLNWEPWTGVDGSRLADEFIQMDFPTSKRKLQRILTHGVAKKKQFVRSFQLSYSDNGVHWKYVTHMGKKKVFRANVNAVDKVINVFPEPLDAWFLRIHILERSPAGAGLKMLLYGCSLVGVDPKTYEVYQRGYLAATGMLVLCNVHPNRIEARPNCYQSLNDGLKWEAIHPSVVNIIGYDTATGTLFGLGVTSSNTALYMQIDSPQSVRVIPQADWDTVKGGATLPTVVPLYPAHGNAYHAVSGTSVTVGSITYEGSPEGLLKTESSVIHIIASWSEYAPLTTGQ